MQLVTARGLRKRVGSGRAARTLLAGANLDLDRGEMVAILGRSGSGKSTLLNVLGGIDRADGGTIEVDGQAVERMGERALTRYRRERVGFIFQLFHLIPELSAEQNVLLPARMAGGRDGNGSAPTLAHGRELMARLGVEGVADQLPHTLSGGEQQRVAIARALVNDASLILADEPTGNLDLVAAEAVLDALRGVCDTGRSVLLVTHERDAAARADRTVRLEDGRLVPG
ncbi:MAG: ABC transporter ATP-binding protein [Solirubrobacterales bacterium]|nr:ABC transporter ATP-binding protein [Solirubrobacterales bacterium]